MSPARRVTLGVVILTAGLGAQAAMERVAETDRPELLRPLATIPMQIGSWQGRDEEVDPEVLREAQTDDYLNRVYEDLSQPGRRLWIWINYSRLGLNLRHSPEVCLPSGGWDKIESQTRQIGIPRPDGDPLPITRLAYGRGELVQGVGFWYYIFGEGPWEVVVRRLPITPRSSHGRTTRGSGLTVEVFCPAESDPDGQALEDFAADLLPELEAILPEDRAQYHIP